MTPSKASGPCWVWALAGVVCLMLVSSCSQAKRPALESGGDATDPWTHAQPEQPPSAKTLYVMSDILAGQGKDTECEFVLRRCIGQYPKFTPAYNRLAELQMRQGRIHQAVDTLSRALETRPSDPVLLNNLGMCLLVRKEHEKALGYFTQAAGLVPESEKYRANMATALGLMGRFEESLALFQQIIPDPQARQNVEVLRKARSQG